MDLLLLKAAAFIYFLATASFVLSVVLPNRPVSRLPSLVLLGGFVVHTLALALHFAQTGYPAMAQLREAISFYSWLMVAVYLLVQIKYRLAVLGSFVAPLACLISLSALTMGTGVEQVPPGLETYWLPLHVTLAFLGNAVFALAFAVSLMYLLAEYQLKNKKGSAFYKRFPSLETLDRLNYVFLVWGFPLMTLGILTGSIWAGIYWGDYWSWDPRQISSALTWLLYGSLLHGRMAGGWRGKKAALLTIVGFVVVLGYFLWGDALFPSRHGGRFE